jgi:hypothetical protein
LPVTTLPVRGTQHALQKLSRWVSWQGFGEINRFWRFVARNPGAAVGDQVRVGYPLTGLSHNDRLDRFAPTFIGDANDRNVRYRRVTIATSSLTRLKDARRGSA